MHVLAALGEQPNAAVRAGRRLSPLHRVRRDQQRRSRTRRRSTTARPTCGRRSPDRPGVTTDDLDGLTVDGPDWWFNLRPSNTEPLLRLNVEAPDDDAMTALRDEVLALVRKET